MAKNNAIVSVDNSQIALLQRGAKNGHPQSQYYLALSYIKGDGIEKNYNEAIKLLESAAKSSLPEAQYDLGILYYEGKIVTGVAI